MNTFASVVFWIVLVLAILLGGFGLGQSATQPQPTWQELLYGILQAVLLNPVVWGLFTTYVLALVPGPFRGLAEAVLAWIKARIEEWLERSRNGKAQTAVLAAAQVMAPHYQQDKVDPKMLEHANYEAKRYALDVAQTLGIPQSEAEARIEAAFRELKAQGQVQ